MSLVRRAPEGSYFADGDRASGVFGALATGFAIFAGFVIFLAFTTYDDARSGAEAEALMTREFNCPAPHGPPTVPPACARQARACGAGWRRGSERFAR
jgi:hypothetical protein